MKSFRILNSCLWRKSIVFSHDTQNVTSEDVFIEKLNETRTQIESINLDLFKKKHTDDEARAMEAEEQRQKWSQERAKEGYVFLLIDSLKRCRYKWMWRCDLFL